MELEGAKFERFLGLKSRFLCGDGNGAAEADATAVDMVVEKKRRKKTVVERCNKIRVVMRSRNKKPKSL